MFLLVFHMIFVWCILKVYHRDTIEEIIIVYISLITEITKLVAFKTSSEILFNSLKKVAGYGKELLDQTNQIKKIILSSGSASSNKYKAYNKTIQKILFPDTPEMFRV